MVTSGATPLRAGLAVSQYVYVSAIDGGAGDGKMKISAVRQVDIKNGNTFFLCTTAGSFTFKKRSIFYMLFHPMFIALFETDIEGVFFLSAFPGRKPLTLADKEGRFCVPRSVFAPFKGL